MCTRNLIDAIMAGDEVTSLAELKSELDQRSEDIIEQGRAFIAASVQNETGAATE